MSNLFAQAACKKARSNLILGMQVECPGFALVGETATLRFEIRTSKPAIAAAISLKGGFLEGGPPPRLSLRDPEGDEPFPPSLQRFIIKMISPDS